MIESGELVAGIVAGAIVAVGHLATLITGHRSVRRELRSQRMLITLICEKLGVEPSSGPHLIERKKT
jgi:hypothetical protein